MSYNSPNASGTEDGSSLPIARLFKAIKSLEPDTKILMATFATNFIVAAGGVALLEKHHPLSALVGVSTAFAISDQYSENRMRRLPPEEGVSWKRANHMTYVASAAGNAAGVVSMILLLPGTQKATMVAWGAAMGALVLGAGASFDWLHRRDRSRSCDNSL